MKNENLNKLFNELVAGYRYGRDIDFDYYHNEPMRYPYFECAVSYDGVKKIFRYSHFGSSAVKATKKELKWLIETIFNLSVDDFASAYIRNDASKYA